MSARAIRVGVYAVLASLFVLHNDLWLWQEAGMLAGLPAGLAYHVAFCLVVSGVMFVLVRFAWPRELTHDDDESLSKSQ